ncbi:MAG: histidine phosphatase family protein [Coriobacteriales bacterium]|nr:histidine phosphatase family protein [Coriobacteriales bacterium]
MSLTVVLIRHGLAKNKRLGETDKERKLTKSGAAALEEWFPRALSLVDTTSASELWVSDAVRARQTAEIANKTLNIETYRELPCLYAQDQERFLDELSQTNADVVVAVGHIPFMEDMFARLSGNFMGFGTGAVAAIELSDTSVRKISKGLVRGSLLWFLQGPLV